MSRGLSREKLARVINTFNGQSARLSRGNMCRKKIAYLTRKTNKRHQNKDNDGTILNTTTVSLRLNNMYAIFMLISTTVCVLSMMDRYSTCSCVLVLLLSSLLSSYSIPFCFILLLLFFTWTERLCGGSLVLCRPKKKYRIATRNPMAIMKD